MRRERSIAALAAAGLLAVAPLTAQEVPSEPPAPGLGALLEPFVHEVVVSGGELGGPGAAILRDEAARSRFFLFGEQHATAEIAELALALYRAIAPSGYAHAVIEVGPAGARHLEALLRDEDPEALAAYLREGTNLFSIPFFFFREEAALARAIVEESPAAPPVLWGVDQEFIAGAPPLLERLEALAATEDERAAVAALREAATADPMLLGAAPAETIESLVAPLAASADPEMRDLAGQMIATNRIYAPFTGRGGSVWAANHEREELMKRLFLRRYRSASEGEAPRVFVKLGANHLFRGLSPTHVLSFGTFLHELALVEGGDAYHLHVDCRGGEAMNVMSGTAEPCESYFLGADSALSAALPADRTVLVDLRALRNAPDVLQALDEPSRDLVWSFDGYVAVPDPHPSTLFPGRRPDLGN